MRLAAALAAALLAGCAHAAAPDVESVASSDVEEAQAVDLAAVLERYDFAGTLAVEGGPADGFARDDAQVWPFASVTKQLVATIVMQEREAGRLDLDEPVSKWLPEWPADGPRAPTLRELLRHQSGLYDPEDDPDFDWNGALPLDPMMCVARRTMEPGGDFNYTNCDTLLVARVLQRTTGQSIGELVEERLAKPLGMTSARFATPDTELPPSALGTPAREIALYGASGGLVGSARDLLRFDRALMDGDLLGETARAEMWQGEPALGYTALGQWEFAAPLAGCEGSVRIIERRGAIGGYQARNFIFPERDIAIVAFTGRGENEYAFGEIWTGEGLSYDLLSAAVCGGGA